MDLISNQGKFIPFHSQLFNREINETLFTSTALVFLNLINRSFLYSSIGSFIKSLFIFYLFFGKK